MVIGPHGGLPGGQGGRAATSLSIPSTGTRLRSAGWGVMSTQGALVSMQLDGDLIYEVNGAIGVVTFNRPLAHNALTFEMYDRLGEICASVPADGSLRVLIITGAGGRAFSAGTDISLFRDFRSAADGLAYEERLERMFGKLERCEVPTIAAIAGVCTGGDVVIAGEWELGVGLGRLNEWVQLDGKRTLVLHRDV